MKTFVIVGGGLAGATAALTLRREGFDGRVVLVCGEDHPPYSRPPLSKAVVRGESPPEKTHLRPPRMWESNEIELLLGVGADALDTGAHRVHLGDGSTLSYDKLLLATGGVPRRLRNTEGIDCVQTLGTIEDSLVLRDHLAQGRSLAVIGAGFIGAELAASAVAVGAPVTVLEALSLPLARVLPPTLSEVYARLHRERGVDLRTGVAVAEVRGRSRGATIVDADGNCLNAERVLISIGLELDLRLAQSAGLQTRDGIIVDRLCRTSVPDVFAAGDIANHPNELLGHRLRVEHWQHAQHQGAAAGRNMLGMNQPFTEVPWVWTEQYEFNLQIAGLPAPDDRIVLRGDPESLEFAAFLIRDGRLAAVVGVNRPDEVRAGRTLIAEHASPSDAELEDRDLDLATLTVAGVAA